ncbi:hypothetical protein FXO38_04902 [Capsicum annuum]|nr:hypothetical protein FXO38_04902 [Capsicum annuum]
MVSEGDTNPNSLHEESEIAHDSLFKPPFTLEVQLSEYGSPVVIRDSMDQWPAKNKWNGMNYLRKVAGFRTVPIEPSRVGLNLCQDGAGCRESVLRWSKMLQMRYSFSGIKRNRREPDMVGLVSDYDLLALDSGLCIRLDMCKRATCFGSYDLHFEYSSLSVAAAPYYKED